MAGRSEPRASGTRERHRVGVAFAVAALAHACLLGWAWLWPQPLALPIEPSRPLDVDLVPVVERSAEGGRREHTDASAPDGRAAPRSDERTERTSRARRSAAGEAALAAGSEAAEDAVGGETVTDSPEGEGEAVEHGEPPTRRLSLSDLGVGAGNPFLAAPRAAPPDGAHDRRKLRENVERVLADGIARDDQRRGLGPEGPILARLEQAAHAGRTPPNANAVFHAVTEQDGRLVALEVIEASSDQALWRELAERVLAGLRSTRLRGTHGANGLTMRIRVVTRISLPSGRDPGLDVDVLGVPVKRADGKRASRIRILDPLPKLQETEVTSPDGRTVKSTSLDVALLALEADPADIGSPASRVVHARLERLWAN